MSPASPAGQHTVRRHNTGLVLGAIAEAGAISRAAVAARTGLTKATVSTLVETLINAGLVRETGPEQRVGRGRRGTELSLSPAGPHGLGVEIGVDYLAACLVDLTGAVRKQRLRGGDNRTASPTRVLGRLAALIRTALADADGLGVSVGGFGVAVPGLVDAATGGLRIAPNLGWRDVDLPAELGARIDLDDRPVLVGNEANCAALAQLWAGAHPELRDFVYVSGEIGIGAGIVIGGGLFAGVRGFGGEIGHLSVDPEGPRCSCGARGCLERMAGLEWIARNAGLPPDEAIDQGSVDAVLARLRAGHSRTLGAVRDAGRWLGVGLADVINVVDVPAIVLGGVYARLAPWLTEPLSARLADRVIGAAWAPVHVLASPLGSYAAVRGAATSVVRSILDDPEPFLTGMSGSLTMHTSPA